MSERTSYGCEGGCRHRRTIGRVAERIGSLAPLVLLAVVWATGAPLLGAEVQVTLDTGGEQWVGRDAAVALDVTEWPDPVAGRLAVLVGSSDRTDLFRRSGSRLVYRPELLPLPSGETEVVVYLVSPEGAWDEISRHPLRVLGRGGFERLEARPTLDLELRVNHDPGETDEAESQTDVEASGQARWQSSALRDGWTLELQAGVLGASVEEQALRFQQEGSSAPEVDLESYLVKVSRGRGSFQLGHLGFGASRNLMNGFQSRGASVTLPLGPRVELAGAALHGTQIVGWDDLLGLSDSDHRIWAGAIRAELRPRPGALSVSGSYLDATVRPLVDFDRGGLADREESSGWSLDLATSTSTGRFALRGGFARSTFDNPDDPLLSQGAELVEVEQETRDAWYVEIDLGLVRGVTLGEATPFTMDLALARSHVDPLYRSVGVFVASDIQEDRAELTAALGEVTARAGHVRSEDNLDEIPSVLKTKTRQNTGALFLPLSRLTVGEGKTERRWLPALSYNYGRTHQFGDSLPIDAGFSPGHVPDQVSLVHTLSLDWQGNAWRLGAGLGTSDQDNRQPGRELNDFETLTESLNLSFSPHARTDLGLNLTRETSDDLAAVSTASTVRYGLNLNWRLGSRNTLEAVASESRSEDDPRTRESESRDLSLQWNLRLGGASGEHGWSGQLHLLFTHRELFSRDVVFGFEDQLDHWTLSGGLSVSIF